MMLCVGTIVVGSADGGSVLAFSIVQMAIEKISVGEKLFKTFTYDRVLVHCAGTKILRSRHYGSFTMGMLGQ